MKNVVSARWSPRWLAAVLLSLFAAAPGSAAVQYQSLTEAFASSDATSVAILTPAGTTAGDLLIAAVVTDGDTSATLAPALGGWSLIDVGTEGAVTLGVWWKLAGAAEPPTHTFTWAGGEQVYGWVMRFTGHDPVSPIHAVSAPTTGTSATPVSPSVATSVENAFILRLGAFDDDDVTIGSTGLSTGTDITMGESSALFGSTSGGSGYSVLPTPGPSGTDAFQLTASENFRTLTLALAPQRAASGALAEIDPNTVAQNAGGLIFNYDIYAIVGGGDTGVDAISVTVPASFGTPTVTDVQVGGVSVASYTDNTSGKLIRVVLDPADKLTTSDRIRIVFTADAPSCPDELGAAFTSTVDDSSTASTPPQETVEGDGNQDGGGDGDRWRVATTGVSCWYGDPGYQYRKRLCLNGAQIGGALTDFPALVSFTDADLTTAIASGYDIFFTNDDGVTRLDYERESWDQPTGKLTAWVRFPRLEAGLDKSFYVYYGKPSETVDQQSPNGVWDASFQGVWHLEESGSGSLDEFRDSTANANHGQGGEGTLSNVPTRVAGIIGNAQYFDGTNDFVAIPKVENDLDIDRGTMSAWLTVDPGNGARVVVEARADLNNLTSLWWNESAGAFQMKYEAGGTESFIESALITEDSTWHFATLTWDTVADETRIYIDGIQVGATQTGLGTWVGAFNGLATIGAQPSNGRPLPHEGLIDEVRISSVARAPEWVQTSYNCQASPATFLKCLGPEELVGVSSASISSAADQSFTVGWLSAISAVTITVRDATGGSVTAGDDIRIRIPAGFPMRWNTAVAGVGLAGAAAAKVDPVVKAYEDGGGTVVLDVVTDFVAGDQIAIGNLGFVSFTAPSPPDNLELEVGNDGLVSAFDDRTITIVPALGPTLSSETDQVFTFMQSPTPAATLYVSEGQSSFINAVDDITIRIPGGYPVLWESTVTTVAVGGNAAFKVSSAVTYEIGDRGVILDVLAPFVPGDFISIAGLVLKDFSAVAGPTNLQLDVVTASDVDDKIIEVQGVTDVPFFTATATNLRVDLEWVSPPFGNCVDIVVVRRLGGAPTPALFDWSDVLPCPAIPGSYQSTVDTPPTNDTTYDYGIYVFDGATYSPGKFVRSRPFDSNPGPVKWAYSTGATSMAPPGLRFSGGNVTVYAVSNDDILHAVQAVSGTWPPGWKPFRFDAPAQARPPLVPFAVGTAANGVAFVGSQDGSVYAIDADSGNETWSRSIAAMVQAAPAGNFVYFDPLAHDLVLVGTRNSVGPNSLEALNVADGLPVWSFVNSLAQGGDDKLMGIVSGAATVHYATRRVVFATRQRSGGSQNTIWCVDFDSGSPSLVWAKNLGNVDGSPVIDNGVVYVGTNAGEIYALEAGTGNVNWSLPLLDGPVKGFVFPQFWMSNVFASTTQNVWSIHDNGGSGVVNTNWPVATLASPSTPLWVPGTSEVLVGSGDGRLYQLDSNVPLPADSVVLGDGSAAVGMPTMDVLNLMFYVGTDEGVIYGVEFPLP